MVLYEKILVATDDELANISSWVIYKYIVSLPQFSIKEQDNGYTGGCYYIVDSESKDYKIPVDYIKFRSEWCRWYVPMVIEWIERQTGKTTREIYNKLSEMQADTLYIKIKDYEEVCKNAQLEINRLSQLSSSLKKQASE